MIEENGTKHRDYEASVTERQRSFIARASGAVVGAITGVVTGRYLLKKSLRKYLETKLFARDWMNGNAEHVIMGVASGKFDTISGAITDPEKLKQLEDDIRNGKPMLNQGTLIGDPVANKALRDLYQHNTMVPDPSLPEKRVFKEGFLKDAVEKFSAKLKDLTHTHDTDIAALEKKYFASGKDHAEIRREINSMRDFLRSITEPEQRNAKTAEFEAKKLINGNVHKFLEEEQKIISTLRDMSNDMKRKLVDIPVFDEMMKHGTEPGRMGLKLRHSDNRGEIILFAAGAAVAVGYIAHKTMNSYLHRNDKRKEEMQTAQSPMPSAAVPTENTKKWADEKVKNLVAADGDKLPGYASAVDKSRAESSQQPSVV